MESRPKRVNGRLLNLAPAAVVIAATAAGCIFFVQFSLTQWGYDDFWSIGLVIIAASCMLLFPVALYVIARLAANLRGVAPSQTLSRHSVIFLPLLLLIRLAFVPEYKNQRPMIGFLIVIVSLQVIVGFFLFHEAWKQRNRSRPMRLLDGTIFLAIIIGCGILLASLRLHDRYLLRRFASKGISYGSFDRVTRRIIYEKTPGRFVWNVEAPDNGVFEIVIFPNENFRAANNEEIRLSYEIRLTPSSGEDFIVSKGDHGLNEVSRITYDVSRFAGQTIGFQFRVKEPFSLGAVFDRVHTLLGLLRWVPEMGGWGPASVMPVYWSEPLVYPRGESDRTNILFIICDTLRADHVGCLGYELNTTPTVDRLAGEGVLFTQAISQSPWTLPSIASMYTGQLPSTHSAGSRKVKFFSKLSPQLSLITLLRHYGYYLGGFVNNPYLSPGYGMHEGFNEYHYYLGNAEQCSDLACAWLEAHAEKKFFLLLHYMDPHRPYDMIESFRSQLQKGDGAEEGTVEEKKFRYDTEIAFTDHQIGRVLEKLSALKLRENTMVVFVSDHGEEFMDHSHDWDHGHTLYDELLRVPLIISYAARLPRGMRIAYQVRLIDIFPTIGEILNLKLDEESVAGESLLPLISGDVAGNRVAVSEFLSLGYEQKAIRTDYHKLIYTLKTKRAELYDLSADPRESVDLAERNTAVRDELLERLRAERRRSKLRRTAHVEAPSLDEATIESLKSLGYIK